MAQSKNKLDNSPKSVIAPQKDRIGHMSAVGICQSPATADMPVPERDTANSGSIQGGYGLPNQERENELSRLGYELPIQGRENEHMQGGYELPSQERVKVNGERKEDEKEWSNQDITSVRSTVVRSIQFSLNSKNGPKKKRFNLDMQAIKDIADLFATSTQECNFHNSPDKLCNSPKELMSRKCVSESIHRGKDMRYEDASKEDNFFVQTPKLRYLEQLATLSCGRNFHKLMKRHFDIGLDDLPRNPLSSDDSSSSDSCDRQGICSSSGKIFDCSSHEQYDTSCLHRPTQRNDALFGSNCNSPLPEGIESKDNNCEDLYLKDFCPQQYPPISLHRSHSMEDYNTQQFGCNTQKFDYNTQQFDCNDQKFDCNTQQFQLCPDIFPPKQHDSSCIRRKKKKQKHSKKCREACDFTFDAHGIYLRAKWPSVSGKNSSICCCAEKGVSGGNGAGIGPNKYDRRNNGRPCQNHCEDGQQKAVTSKIFDESDCLCASSRAVDKTMKSGRCQGYDMNNTSSCRSPIKEFCPCSYLGEGTCQTKVPNLSKCQQCERYFCCGKPSCVQPKSPCLCCQPISKNHQGTFCVTESICKEPEGIRSPMKSPFQPPESKNRDESCDKRCTPLLPKCFTGESETQTMCGYQNSTCWPCERREVCKPCEPSGLCKPSDSSKPPEVYKPPVSFNSPVSCQPVEPSKSIDPCKPSESHKCSEPNKSLHPCKPSESHGPSKPNDSLYPCKPSEPNESLHLCKPSESHKPSEPNESLKQSKSSESHRPSEPNESLHPCKPSEPNESLHPCKPSEPNESLPPCIPSESHKCSETNKSLHPCKHPEPNESLPPCKPSEPNESFRPCIPSESHRPSESRH